MCLKNIQVVRDIDLHKGPLDAIVLSGSDLILFVAGQNGVVLSLMLPIMAEIKHKEFNMHNKNITKVYKLFHCHFKIFIIQTFYRCV